MFTRFAVLLKLFDMNFEHDPFIRFRPAICRTLSFRGAAFYFGKPTIGTFQRIVQSILTALDPR